MMLQYLQFPATRWSIVAAAAEFGTAEGDEAFDKLCRAYWSPVCEFVKSKNFDPDTAADITQGMFEDFLTGDTISRAERAKGRFRTFLLTVATRYISRYIEGATAKRRGGNMQRVRIDMDSFEPDQPGPGHLDPQAAFEREWTRCLLRRVLSRLEADYVALGQEREFRMMVPYLVPGRGEASYRKVGKEMGRSEDAIKMAVYRFRKRYASLLHDEVADTIAEGEDVKDEVHYLLSLFGTNSGEPFSPSDPS